MSKNDEFCKTNEKFCIKDEELCIKYDEFGSSCRKRRPHRVAIHIKNHGFCIINHGFCIINHRFCIKNDGFCIINRGFCIQNSGWMVARRNGRGCMLKPVTPPQYIRPVLDARAEYGRTCGTGTVFTRFQCRFLPVFRPKISQVLWFLRGFNAFSNRF